MHFHAILTLLCFQVPLLQRCAGSRTAWKSILISRTCLSQGRVPSWSTKYLPVTAVISSVWRPTRPALWKEKPGWKSTVRMNQLHLFFLFFLKKMSEVGLIKVALCFSSPGDPGWWPATEPHCHLEAASHSWLWCLWDPVSDNLLDQGWSRSKCVLSFLCVGIGTF